MHMATGWSGVSLAFVGHRLHCRLSLSKADIRLVCHSCHLLKCSLQSTRPRLLSKSPAPATIIAAGKNPRPDVGQPLRLP